MGKKERIEELETELKILSADVFVSHYKTGLHAHHNKKIIRYLEIIKELERISLKWKIKKLFKKRGF